MNYIKYLWLLIGMLSVGSSLYAQLIPPLLGPYPILSNGQPIGGDTVQVCIGDSVTFQSSALNLPLLNINNFFWDFNGAIAVNPGNVSSFTTNNWLAPGVYPIVHIVRRRTSVILPFTNSDPDTLWLAITAIPSSIAAVDTFTCRGRGIALEPTLVASSDSITWFPSPTLSYGRQDSVWVTPSISTTYQYKAYTQTNYNGIERGFCSSFLNTRVTVLPPPIVRTIADTTVCTGDNALLDIRPPLPPFPINPVSFIWSTDRNFTTILGLSRQVVATNMTTTTRYYVRMTDGNGCVGVDSMNVVVRPRPTPPIASVLDDTLCIGERIALRASDTTLVNFWRGPNGFGTPLGLFDIPVISPLQTGYYVITSRGGFGCPSFPDSVYVTINPVPSVPPIVGTTAFCEGVPLQLWATPNAGTFLYWQAPNGDSLSGNNLLINADSSHYLSGTWILWVQDGAGCENRRDTLITIYPAPVLNTRLLPITVCRGDSVTLRAPILPNVTTYNWLDQWGNSVARGAVAFINNIITNTTFFLEVNTAQGCSYVLDSIVVTVNNSTAAPIIYVDTLACVGERNTVFTTDTATSYYWRRNGQALSYVDTFIIDTVRLADAGLYVLSVVDTNGCVSDSTTVNFIVNRRPSIPVVDTVVTVCIGDTVFLKATAVAGLTAVWRGPGGTRLNEFEVALPPDSAYYNNGFWRLIVTDSLTTCRRRSEDVEVVLLNRPTIRVSNSGPVCLGQTATMTVTDSLNSGAMFVYTWYRDALLADTVGIGSTITINNIQADSTFYVVATNGAGCSSVIKSTTIALDAIPPPPNVTNGPVVVCEGDNVSLGTSNFGAVHQWTGPNNYSNNTQFITIPSIQPNQAGTYSAVVTYLNSCPSRPATVDVVVNPTPSPPIAVVPFYLCGNDTLFLRADSSSHCGQLNWVGRNTANFPITGNTVALPPGDPNHVGGNWRVECTDNVTGCVSSSAPRFLLIYPAPDTPRVVVVPPICSGDSVNLSISSVINTGDIVGWYADSTLSNFVDSGATIRVGPIASSRVYYVMVTNFGGCSSVVMPLPVTVLPISAPPIIVGDSSYCVNDTILLTTPITNSSDEWTSNAGWSSTGSPALVTSQANASHVGTYNLRVKDSNGCWSSTASLTITINNNPTPPVAYSNSPICAGTPLTLLTNANCGQLQWYGSLGVNNAVVLPSDSAYRDNSQWLVECIDSVTGCSSVSNSIVIQINEAPQIDSLSIILPACEGDSLLAIALASTASNSPLQYSWYGDSTRTTLLGDRATLSIRSVNQSFSLYLVITDTLTGCERTTTLPVTINPLPNPPIITGNLTYCEGEDLFLTTTTVASQYYWTGPNGWVTSDTSSQRVLSLLDSGTYYLSIADSVGCFSATSSVVVVVNPLPDTITTYSGGGVCVGQDGNLLIGGGSAGTTYDWYQLPNNNYRGAGTNLVVPTVQASDSAYYYAVATLNGCSLISDSVLLPVYAPTAVAEAGANQLLCDRDTTTLLAQVIPSNITGTWISTSAVAIQQPNSWTTAIGPLPVGSHVFYWSLSTTTCINFAIDSVVIEVLPAANEQANAGSDQQYCGVATINLAAIAPQIGTGCWTQSPAQSSAGVVVLDSLNPTTGLAGLQEGQQYSFVWTLKNGSCGVYSMDTMFLFIDSVPSTAAFAGMDQNSCLGDSISLQAVAAPSGQTGIWTSLNGGAVLFPNQANSPIINLPVGSHQFVWALSTNNCSNYSRDTVIVTIVLPQPLAQADYFVLSSNNSTIDVIGNDQLPNRWTINIQQSMDQGQLTNLNTGEFTVTLPNVTTQQSFIYQLCDAICVNSCDTAIVLLSVEQLIECPIPNIFTPNNDGVNDQFEIPCLSEQNTAYLAVYNRWGDEVYKSDNYFNQWDGKHKGAFLPDGTYFYILQWEDKSKVHGSVEIRR